MHEGSEVGEETRAAWLVGRRLLGAALCLGLFLGTTAYSCGGDVSGDPPGQPPPTAPQCPAWDNDCDHISNAVETNSANAHHGFNPNVVNANPSRARGAPNNGWLENGINLVDHANSNAFGYFHYYGTDPMDYDDWGTLHLINTIEQTGRAWADRITNCGRHHTADWPWCNFPKRFGVGDMSLRNGGYFAPHSSHRNGLDSDHRYLRKTTGAENGNFDACSQWASQADSPATRQLLAHLVDAHNHAPQTGKVTLLIIGTCVPITWANKPAHLNFTNDAGHNDHFHIRIEDPDGTHN